MVVLPVRSSIKKKPSLIRFGTIDSIDLGKSSTISHRYSKHFNVLMVVFCLEQCVADPDLDKETQLSEQHLQHYRNMFMDVLISFVQLKLDPVSIGEGFLFLRFFALR